MNADSSGIRSATSAPVRYQPARVVTAKVWRLWGIPHKRHYADGWVMCPAVAFPLLGAEEPALQFA